MKRKSITILILIILILGGLIYFYKTPFKSNIWVRIDSFTQGVRLDMVDDLMENHLKKGMHYSEFTNLIGKEDHKKIYKQKEILSFDVYEDFGSDIDPIGYTYLDLEMDKDSLLIGFNLRKVKIENQTMSHDDIDKFIKENQKID